MKRAKWLIILLALLVLPLVVWRIVSEWQQRQLWMATIQADRDLERGQPQLALARLSPWLRDYPDEGGLRLREGVAQEQLGRRDEAMKAWRRIRMDQLEYPQAKLGEARLLAEQGQFLRSEWILEDLVDYNVSVRGNSKVMEVRKQAQQLFERLLRYQGRLDEVRTLLKKRRDFEDPPAEEIYRSLWRLDSEPFPIEGVEPILRQAYQTSPNDEHVQLGLARLLTRAGKLDEAATWLEPHFRKPFEEIKPLAWQAELEWAKAANRPDLFALILRESPVTNRTITDKLEWGAWLYRQRNDTVNEVKWLQALVQHAPGHAEAVERLTELALKQKDVQAANRWRTLKSQISEAKRVYRLALDLDGPINNYAELAQSAEVLGRWDEAAGWRSLAKLPSKPHADSTWPTDLDWEQVLSLFRRPVTDAANPVQDPQESISFKDQAQSHGLQFQFNNGQNPNKPLAATMCGGIALGDFNGDGWLDVFALQGGSFPPSDSNPPASDRYFRNLGRGRFEDSSEQAGLNKIAGGYSHGVAVGDYDNDKDLDILITRWDRYQLLKNRGNGEFEDATQVAGLAGERVWPTSVAFADIDQDGDLDLYVCHYLKWDPQSPKICKHPESGQVQYCDPRLFPAEPDRLFRNDQGKFVDITESSGILASDKDGRGLGVVAADFNNDGRIDFFVANDTTANFLFLNRGQNRFEEVGHQQGVAGNAAGGYQAGMGVACGDIGHDGWLDLAVTNFYGESTTIYRNQGDAIFLDQTAQAGLKVASKHLLGFGAVFGDFDNDGQLDLATANGHVNDLRPAAAYAMPMQLARGLADGKFEDVSAQTGDDLITPGIGRGLALGDLDHDGRQDLVAVFLDRPLAWLHNERTNRHFATFLMQGTRSNSDGVGVRLKLTLPDGSLRHSVRLGGGSYLSASDPRLHFGLGDVDRIPSVEATWPSGQVDVWQNLAVDRVYRLKEGSKQAEPISLP